MMSERKRPAFPTSDDNDQHFSKSSRIETAEGTAEDSVFSHPRGRRRRRCGWNRTIPNTRPRAPSPPPRSIDTSRLLNVLSSSSLFYEGCRSSLDDFPEHIPTSFDDTEHYLKTFLPLLYEEAKESIKSALADCCENDIFWDATIHSVDGQGNGWNKVTIALGNFRGKQMMVPRLFQSHSVVLTNIKPTKRDPVENLQRKLKKQKQQSQATAEAEPPLIVVVAVVVQIDRERELMTLLTRPVCDLHFNEADSPCRQIAEHLKQFPEPWLLFPTGGIVTQQRECDILHALDKIPLMNAILKPDQVLKMDIDNVSRKMPVELGYGIQEHLRQTFDPSQSDAIFMTTAHFSEDETNEKPILPVMLIQGPPGTGKTHTVVGILNLWHLVQFERYYKRILAHFRNSEPETMKKTELTTTRTSMKPRILVCAPSNAAVDELVERILIQGFRDSSGHTYKPNIIRIGAEDVNYSDDTRLVVLDTLVSGYRSLKRTEWEISLESNKKKLQLLENEIVELHRKLRADEASIEVFGGELISKMEKLEKAETEIRRLLLVENLIERKGSNERIVQEDLELDFLEHAEMVFTTLSSSGKKVLSKVRRGFATVLIDEAAQASEVAALQPLVYGCQQCVLVGDPQQLPATIISQKGKQLKMERSLFERLQEGGAPVKVLKTQYRMHPWIRRFPSAYFYNDMLMDGRNVLERPPESFYDHDLLKPYVVFDVPTGIHERQGGGSLQNQVEADLAAALFKELRDHLISKQKRALQLGKKPPPAVRVGVLTPYRSQTKCLTATFLRCLGAAITGEVKIMTVDSFQGKQLDVVIFSCVRGSIKSSSVGFVADIRRMNVAITRARKALWILGNFGTLVGHPAWAALEADARERECIIRQSTAQSLFPHQTIFDQRLLTCPPKPKVKAAILFLFLVVF